MISSGKSAGVSRSIKHGFQRIAGDMGALFNHVVNLAYWKSEEMLIPSWSDDELRIHNGTKPKFINSRQLHGKFYFYYFGGNKESSRGVALLLDDNGRRVFKKRDMNVGKGKVDQFVDLDDDLRARLLSAEDVDGEFVLWLKSNGRKGLN